MSGSPQTESLMRHPSLGKLYYNTVYFAVEEPILFTCFFDNFEDMYVGVKVEDFLTQGKRVESWYFCGVLENEVKMLESKPGKLKEIFDNRPVIWCNKHGDIITWKKHSRVAPFYSFAEETTLS